MFQRRAPQAMVCIGHSHIGAIATAAAEVKLPCDVIAFWIEPGALRHDGEGLALRQDLVRRLTTGAPILASVGGSAHSVLGMVEHPRPFDFVLPSDPDLPTDPDRELAPAAGVRAALAALNAEFDEILELIVRVAAGAPVSQLEPPPPVADAERIFPHVPWSFFPGRPRKLAPRWLRYKLWRMHSELIAESCERLGVTYIRAPREAQDHDGFLRAGLDNDGIHAGTAYGRLVLQCLSRAA